MAQGSDPIRLDWTTWLNRWLDEGTAALSRLEPDAEVEGLTEGDTHVVRVELPGVGPDRDVELRIRAERRQATNNQEILDVRVSDNRKTAPEPRIRVTRG